MAAPAGWIFQAVPEQYNLWKALADFDEDVWLARQRAADMAPGQPVFIWLARKGGGLVAAGELTSIAEDQGAPSWQLPYWTPAAHHDAHCIEARVHVRYEKKFITNPLTRSFLKLNPLLQHQQPIGPVYVGTNFAMSHEAVRAIQAYLSP